MYAQPQRAQVPCFMTVALASHAAPRGTGIGIDMRTIVDEEQRDVQEDRASTQSDGFNVPAAVWADWAARATHV